MLSGGEGGLQIAQLFYLVMFHFFRGFNLFLISLKRSVIDDDGDDDDDDDEDGMKP